MPARLFMGFLQYLDETQTGIQLLVRDYAILLLPSRQVKINHFLQFPESGKVNTVKVNMEHRVFQPVLFQAVYLQTLEQVLVPQEIMLQRRNQKAFSKTPGASQKINLSFRHKGINQVRLVHINVTTINNLVKTLDAYRVFHGAGAFKVFVTKLALFHQINKSP